MSASAEFGGHCIGDSCPVTNHRYVEDLMRSNPQYGGVWPTGRITQIVGDYLFAGRDPKLDIFAYLMDKPFIYQADELLATFVGTRGLNNPPLSQFHEGTTFDLKTQNVGTIVRLNMTEAEYEGIGFSADPETFVNLEQEALFGPDTSDKLGIVWETPRSKRKLLLYYPQDGIDWIGDEAPAQIPLPEMHVGGWLHKVSDNYLSPGHREGLGIGIDLALMADYHLINNHFLKINRVDVLQWGKPAIKPLKVVDPPLAVLRLAPFAS